MKNFKKFYSALVIMFALILLVACGDKSTTESKNAAANNEPKTEEKTESNENKDLELGVMKDVDPEKKVYITAKEAKDIIDKGGNCVVAEVTWGEEKDSPDFLTKHIPGAIHINTDMVEEGPIWNLRSA